MEMNNKEQELYNKIDEYRKDLFDMNHKGYDELVGYLISYLDIREIVSPIERQWRYGSNNKWEVVIGSNIEPSENKYFNGDTLLEALLITYILKENDE